MKFLLFGIIGLLSFLGTLLGVLALTGNLSSEALQRVSSKPEPAAAATPATSQDPVGPLAQALKAKEEDLKKRELALKEREGILDQREKDLNKLRTDLEGIRTEVSAAMDAKEEERQMQLQTVAETLEAMRPENAAASLQGMPEKDVADILKLVQTKNRGKIMDAMKGDSGYAAGVLKALQEGRL